MDTPEPDRASEQRLTNDPMEEDMESGREVEVLLRTRIPETLQAIGNNLDRTLSILQRMEHKLGDLTR